jgi:ribosome recycling factor
LVLQSKLDIRNLRKLVLDDVKKIKGAVSADDSKRFTKEVRQLFPCCYFCDTLSYSVYVS